jgi:hydroxymethylglutaryl-CoA lyase
MSWPKEITVVEVGPRDGFQMEREFIPTERKIEIINGLVEAGLRHFEATSFVSPKAIPQLRDAAEVLAGIKRVAGLHLAALVPNPRGADRKSVV